MKIFPNTKIKLKKRKKNFGRNNIIQGGALYSW